MVFMFAQAAKAFYAGFENNVFFSLKLGNMASCTGIIFVHVEFLYKTPRHYILLYSIFY